MRSLMIVCLMVGVSTFGKAQIVVDGVDITKLEDVRFVEIMAMQKFLSQKITVIVDYGQQIKAGVPQKIQGPDGKAIVFESVVAALNFLANNGYEYQDAYALTESSSNVYHFLFRRKE